MLFDSDHARSDGSPSAHGESSFAFLDRVDGDLWARTRDLLNSWVADYPQPARTELIGRFRSKDPKDFGSAYWELLLFSLFSRSGFTVEVHPSVPGSARKPDFLIARSGRQTFVEARVVGESTESIKDASYNEYLRHELNKRVTTDRYWIGFEVREKGSEPPVKKLATAVEDWLSTEPDMNKRWTWTDERSSTEINFVIWHVGNRRKGGPVSSSSSIAQFFDSPAEIRRALTDKAYAYGSGMDAPFVIALSLTDGFVKRQDVFHALFGKGADESQSSPQDAFWHDGKGPRAQRVSGVLIGRSAQPWLLGRTDLELWTNPQANYEVEDFSDCLPISGPHPTTLDERPHTSVLSTFGLNVDWQDNDPFAGWRNDR